MTLPLPADGYPPVSTPPLSAAELKSVSETPDLWLAGDYEHPDFAMLRESLPGASRLSWDEVWQQVVKRQPGPRLLMLCGAVPERFAWRDGEQLRGAWPLTEIWSIVTSWGEGATRTAPPWPTARHLTWLQAVQEFERRESEPGVREANRRRGAAPTWTHADRLLAERPAPADDTATAAAGIKVTHPNDADRHSDEGMIWLRCWEQVTAAAWHDELHAVGYGTRWFPAAEEVRADEAGEGVPRAAASDAQEEPVALLWMGDLTKEIEQQRLSRWHAAWPATPLAVLLHFPREADADVARRCGANWVAGLPLLEPLGDWLRRKLKAG